jgi:hypothetical protein
MEKIKPLANVAVIHGRRSAYPTTIRVAMEDGHVMDYTIKTRDEQPFLREALDAFNAACFGGQKYKENGVGKRTGVVEV